MQWLLRRHSTHISPTHSVEKLSRKIRTITITIRESKKQNLTIVQLQRGQVPVNQERCYATKTAFVSDINRQSTKTALAVSTFMLQLAASSSDRHPSIYSTTITTHHRWYNGWYLFPISIRRCDACNRQKKFPTTSRICVRGISNEFHFELRLIGSRFQRWSCIPILVILCCQLFYGI